MTALLMQQQLFTGLPLPHVVLLLLQALALYKEVIKGQPDNIYALNGIGTCLAGTCSLWHMS